MNVWAYQSAICLVLAKVSSDIVIDGPEELDKLEPNDYVDLSFTREEKRLYTRSPLFYKDRRNRVHIIYGSQRMEDGTVKRIGYIKGA